MVFGGSRPAAVREFMNPAEDQLSRCFSYLPDLATPTSAVQYSRATPPSASPAPSCNSKPLQPPRRASTPKSLSSMYWLRPHLPLRPSRARTDRRRTIAVRRPHRPPRRRRALAIPHWPSRVLEGQLPRHPRRPHSAPRDRTPHRTGIGACRPSIGDRQRSVTRHEPARSNSST